MKYKLTIGFFLSVSAMTLVVTVTGSYAADASLNRYDSRHMLALDYKNPMKLDMDLMRDDVNILSGEPKIENYDYYSSPSARDWAENYHMKPGVQKFNEGNLQGAFREFDFVLRYVPNHPRALVLIGDVSILIKRIDLGEQYFKKAFDLYPETVRASSYKDYGRFQLRAGEYTKAIVNLKKALVLDPELSEAHYLLGLSYLEINDLKSANHHAQIVYSRGFPLSELRERLMKTNAWNPGVRSNQAPIKAGAAKERLQNSRQDHKSPK